jgi:hypothetical protein
MEDPSAYLNPLGKIDQHGSRLPHWQQGDALQFVTFRQKDALPKSKLVLWRSEKAMWLSKHPKPWTPKQTSEYSEVFTERIEEWLDAGMGSCLFNHAENREALKIVIMKAAPEVDIIDDARAYGSLIAMSPAHAGRAIVQAAAAAMRVVLKDIASLPCLSVNRC